jgi:formylglycine-generating enzyme required for sulfatase activity
LLLGLLAAGCSPVAKPVETWTDPTTGMVFIHVPAGSFDMGTPPSEVGREAQERLHRVHLTRSFYLGRTEVTQAQWIAVMGSNPSAFADCGGDDYPPRPNGSTPVVPARELHFRPAKT